MTTGAELFLPPVLQSYEVGPNIAGVFVRVCGSPVAVGNAASLLVQGGLTACWRRISPPDGVAVPSAFDADWYIRAGISTPGGSGLSCYVQLERLSDDMITLTPVPLIMLSVGVGVGM